MSVYDNKPTRFLTLLHSNASPPGENHIFCAGFELSRWRCAEFAHHLTEWLLDFALQPDELAAFRPTDAVKALREAAAHTQYSGAAGELAAHAICRDFFGTFPIASRVWFKTSLREPPKGFDVVHARISVNDELEVWLGEAKFYKDRQAALANAISSVRKHMEAESLKSQKLLLGRKISQSTPHRERIVRLFDPNTTLDDLLDRLVLPIIILGESDAIRTATSHTLEFTNGVVEELKALQRSIQRAEFSIDIRLNIIYVPLKSKDQLASSFDAELLKHVN